MSQIVRFHRPEAPDSICSMFVEDDNATASHIRRMASLGYSVVDDMQGPPERPPMQSEMQSSES